MSPYVISVFMIVTTLALIGFDVFLAADETDGNTFSERIRAAGKKWPPFRLLLAAVFGGLLVHWFGWY